MEGFLKAVAPYFPKGSKANKIGGSEPCTPLGLSGPPTSITKLPTPQKNRTLKFGEIDATKVPPISSITSQGRLTALLNDDPDEDSSDRNNINLGKESENSTNLFSGKQAKNSKDGISRDLKSSQMPPRPPSDSSNSDSESEPKKLLKFLLAPLGDLLQ